MAVVVSDLSPADGAVGVQADDAVTCTLTDASPLDPDLCEIEVNGVSCTAANGLLLVDHPCTIVGGVLTDDYTELDLVTTARLYAGESDVVVVDVNYNSSTLETATFSTLRPEGFGSSADVILEVLRRYFGSNSDVEFLAQEIGRSTKADVRLLVGTRVLSEFTGSGTVGAWAIVLWDGDGVVRGYRLDPFAASGIVQGPITFDVAGAGVVGIMFVYDHQASAVVGVEVLTQLSASGVVFGVNRNNVLEVHVIDERTYLALQEIGVTWS